MSLDFVASSKLPTEWGEFRIHVFSDSDSGKEHLALVFGDPQPGQSTLCRVHSECLTGDALFSLRCDCGSQLKEALRRIAQHGSGVVLYLRQEGRDIGLGNKIRAYALQDQGQDTVEANHALGFAADMRDYSAGAHILSDLGARRVRLMTNNPDKVAALADYGLEVVERVAVEVPPREANRRYLDTKRSKFGHLLAMVGGAPEGKK